MAGIFKEALMEEVRPSPATMDPMLVFAALLLHRSYPAILLDGEGTLVAGAFTPKSTAQPRRQSRTGSGEALPDGSVLMLREEMPVLVAVSSGIATRSAGFPRTFMINTLQELASRLTPAAAERSYFTKYLDASSFSSFGDLHPLL